VIYTTNAIESLNMSLRKVTKNRGSFPNDEAMLKLLYLALNNIAKKWTLPIRDWKAALNRFSIVFGDRMPAYINAGQKARSIGRLESTQARPVSNSAVYSFLLFPTLFSLNLLRFSSWI